ncbi:MAG: 4-hydroxy-tetrahydrodipicolinate reductase [Euryarchaeota archaeon]|nr:4-hydroxy-tetrahydrodipicolinate reductase [Euryarchaeota archaeon]
MTTNNAIKVAVTGACGRMGSLIVDNVTRAPDMELVAAFDKQTCKPEVIDAARIDEVLHNLKPDVLIDFTVASSSIEIIKAAAKAIVRLIVGTTGFTPEQRQEAAQTVEGRVPAIISPNFSIGVNVFWKLVKEASENLPSAAYSAELIEAHHKHKLDAPSGTAIKAMDVIRETDPARTIGSYSIRSGDIVGDHTVLFIGDGERLEITHRAHSRQAFASGAMLAARFIMQKSPGLYSMDDLMTEMVHERR